jgi:hypothetical protein
MLVTAVSQKDFRIYAPAASGRLTSHPSTGRSERKLKCHVPMGERPTFLSPLAPFL